ncbi:hydroxylamine reductase [Desulfobaculum sp. SPO524]|uniref:hydroxylamine reductase n=1 Tax=Desulfobaculum sp. SPO524 TaxID=3378071 RepID=UPI00385218B6
MFCYQCEQRAKGSCTKVGVCGKQPDVAAQQDLLTYLLRGIAVVAVEGRRVGVTDIDADRFVASGLFSTLTNVNFDPARFDRLIPEAVRLREGLIEKVAAAGGRAQYTEGAVTFTPRAGADLSEEGERCGLTVDHAENDDIRSLQHTVLFGLRGVAAYADHARILGKESDEVYAFLHEGLAAIYQDLDLNAWVGLTLKTGEVNLKVMELLDDANTSTYGHPVPTSVPLGHRAGKAILVSGHDLKDLRDILEQTEGKGISVYTHGEMLPCHGYPELKKYSHFYGHYGTAWQNQQREFADFPGAILMTTNCIQKPMPSYMDNIYTTGLVGWPGAQHVTNGDFGPVIDKALAMDGFAAEEDKGAVMTGFARNAVMGVADTVISAVKSGDIRHFFLVAGCDGAKPGRNYYTEFVEKVPSDCVVLTLACGKFRFFDKQLGDIGGIPRLLDVGQCNDAYSAIRIATALAEAFDCGVNDLPLSMVLSWYEQKAVAILLTLLYLGVKDIRLGPTLPEFLTPNVLNVLVENYDIKPIATPDEDLKAILG